MNRFEAHEMEAQKDDRKSWNENRHEHFVETQIDLMNRVIFVAKTSKPIPEKPAKSRVPYFKNEGK